MNARTAAGLLCLTLLFSAGCSPSQQQRAASDVDDARLAAEIHAKLAIIDPATVSLVTVDVLRRAVRLTGQVHSAQERSRVDAAARSVSGVMSVDDRLRVNPKAPTANEIADDMALQAKVKAALAEQTGINALRVQVGVHAGVVVLDGTVASNAVHALVLETAREVSGVRRVVDHLRVEKR